LILGVLPGERAGDADQDRILALRERRDSEPAGGEPEKQFAAADDHGRLQSEHAVVLEGTFRRAPDIALIVSPPRMSPRDAPVNRALAAGPLCRGTEHPSGNARRARLRCAEGVPG